MTLEIIPVKIQKEIQQGDNLMGFILSSKEKLQDGDIIVVAQKIISKQEGRTVNLLAIIPSVLAVGIGKEYKKDPKLIEAILSESKRIIRMENGILIVETNDGIICANAGVDESNVENDHATLLPVDSDKSAKALQQKLEEKTGLHLGVIISDTFGRPFRMGQVNCAIGVAGIESLLDYQGKKDTFGKILRVTSLAIADEISSAAELVMGKTNFLPVAIVRNYKFKQTNGSSNELIRKEQEDLFR